ncbi:MAG TPA: S9 family peptidase [Gammaproteobacteria bacterium]|nr:S9 family peptidase [Gammaproteobacteria bacterium]
MPVEILPFLQWQASLDPRQFYSQPSPPQYPAFYKEQFYYLEQRAAEGGRCVLARQQPDGTKEILTHDGFNIRSRVHEYGGKAFLLAEEHVWFSNDSDRRIYRQKLSPLASPEALTVADSQDMAIDFQLTMDGKNLIFVQEHPVKDDENENSLCALSLHAKLPARPYPLVSGADFYTNPVISPDGSQLAWIEWNHPQMPWDGSLLKTGILQDDHGSLSVGPSSIKTIAGGTECAICQLQYSPTGRLFFALDGRDNERGLQADCWDLYAWDGQSIERITNDDGEFGEAHWIFGQQRYVVLDEERIIAIRTRDGSDQLVEIDLLHSTVSVFDDEHSTGLSQLSPAGQGSVVYAAASFSRATAVHICSAENKEITNWFPAEPLLDDVDISVPQHLSYPTSDGECSHAWYYPPKNHLFLAPEGDKPPLLVMVHGGPTSRCDSALNYQRQYWTGRGFAVLDVNHRGSTGYCRSYRQSLQGQWGLMDSLDVANAVEYAIEQKLAHPRQICIRGGSAGGYLVLRALTLFPDLFCAGACYYGIGNLVTLMEFTHKFEAHYLDGLLAAPYHGLESDLPGSPYYDRSPLHDLASLKCPMIIFQGLEDKVVPPELSRELVKSLQARGVYHQYIEYPGEGHGFRNLETRIDALEKESAFFNEVVSG